MKISKLLLGVLIVALAVPAFASQITLIKEIDVGDPPAYLVGETVHFVVIIENPVTNTKTNTITAIEDTLPDGSTLWLLEPGVDPNLVQAPGDSNIYYVDYVVDANDLIEVGEFNIVTNQVHVDGFDSATPVPDVIDATTSKSALVVSPDINIEKVGDAMAFCEGDDPNVVYTYYVDNTGDEPLTDVEILDDTCGPLVLTDNGDGDPNLDIGETWTYECEMQVTEDTLNLVIVDANGYWTGAHVSDVNEWEVLELPPPVVTVSPDDATICDANDQTFCADVTGGIGPFTYSWTLDGVPIIADTNCITVSEPGEYCVTVYDTETRCDANDCGTLTTVPAPKCSIDSGPTSLCEDDIGILQTYCTTEVADGYLWEIIDGNAVIDGNDDEPCVDVNALTLGTITLKLSLYNDVPGDDEHCWDGCQIVITVEECGGGFCTFTQGFYGNKGGRGCGLKTPDLIDELLLIGGPVVVGLPGNSITLGTSDCIIDLLPAGGTPAVLPAGDFDCNDTVNDIPSEVLKESKGKGKGNSKPSRFNNVLIGQTVALTLNLRLHEIPCTDANGFDQALGDYVFPDANYICVQQGEEGCIERYEIPESLQGLSVNELLIAANMALAGDEELVAGAYAGASFVNELFDECWTIVSCPVDPVEDCDDGCDNDFDGLVDEADPDCFL